VQQQMLWDSLAWTNPVKHPANAVTNVHLLVGVARERSPACNKEHTAGHSAGIVC
jgi:hypothetical protein